jgi:hypothetical protein
MGGQGMAQREGVLSAVSCKGGSLSLATVEVIQEEHLHFLRHIRVPVPPGFTVTA